MRHFPFTADLLPDRHEAALVFALTVRADAGGVVFARLDREVTRVGNVNGLRGPCGGLPRIVTVDFRVPRLESRGADQWIDVFAICHAVAGKYCRLARRIPSLRGFQPASVRVADGLFFSGEIGF